MKFNNVYTKLHNKKSLPGEKVRPKYRPVYDSHGVYHLEIDGQVNSYDDIQAHAESCDLSLIMERYNMTGDSSLLNQRNGFYEDIIDYPKNYAEMQNELIQANLKFMELPIDIREKFGQDPAQFYMSYGSPEWIDKLGIVKEQEREVIKEGDTNVEKSE